jgi:hypothetical protein
MQGEKMMTTHKTGTQKQWLVAWLAGVRRALDIKETCMSTMMKVRRHALGMALATAVALATGGPLHAATPSKAVPVSPSEGTAQELSAPPAEVGDLSLPDNAPLGEMVSKTFPRDDAQTRAGQKLPCGLSYFENAPQGTYRTIAVSIGNCHNFGVFRTVNLEPNSDRPTCVFLGPHTQWAALLQTDPNQHVSKRGTGMVECRP